MHKRTPFIILCLLTLGFVSIFAPRPAHAQDKAEQGLLQKLLPSLKPRETYNPYTNLKAPFAEPEVREQEDINLYRQTDEENQKTLLKLQSNLTSSAKAVPVHKPHANLPEIRDWLVTAVSASLTFSDNSSEEIQDALKYFAPNGRKDYLLFLKDNGLIDILKSKGYRVNTIFREPPLLLNETEAQGRYKWSFEAELMTTYLPITAKDYRAATARNENFSLRVQITRAPDEENPQDGLLIEIWQAKDN